MLNRFAAALLLLVPTACGSAPAGEDPGPAREDANGIVFQAERSTYAPGDTIGVRLMNETDAEVGHNLCFMFFTLERRRGAEWVPVQRGLAPAPYATCELPLYILRSGHEATGVAYLPRRLRGGTYRLSAEVGVAGQNRRIATGPFIIRRRGAFWFLPRA